MTKLCSPPAGGVLVAIHMSQNLIDDQEAAGADIWTVDALSLSKVEAPGNYHRPLSHRLVAEGLSCASSRRMPLPESARRCTTAGTRTTRRT